MHICFVLHPKFQMLAYVLASEILRIANRNAGQSLFTWETRSATSQPVQASNGRIVVPDATGWADTVACDLVLVLAGYDPMAVCPPGLGAFLRRAARSGADLGGVDTGVSILAAFGLLNGARVAMHHEAEAGFREIWPDVVLSDGIYCFDRNRLSAAGGTATGDAMLAWIAGRVSAAFAEDVAEDLIHGSIRPPSDRQQHPDTHDPLLEAMRARMLSHIDAPLSISRIADHLGVSMKRLRGRCCKTLGKTPSDYYLHVRLSHARNLLEATDMPVTEVALATGFGSHSGFTKAFRQCFGKTPRAVQQAARRRWRHGSC